MNYDPDFDPGASDEKTNMAILVSLVIAWFFYLIFGCLGFW